ncbi:hypothetical protein EVAR_103463_1 [Eumeta japonica]|uniref:Uncharacterized protein n=1 Tax=Eumeta variegata TaxID=151549 RepID=A0A4C1YTR5_EUMVA|nr:hypothetical protein EVAR_103463_1 [Eumeta japonica]
MLKNEVLDTVDKTLFLGLTLESKLRWNSHIMRLAKILGSAAYAVKRIRPLTDHLDLEFLCVASVRIEGGDQCCDSARDRWINVLFEARSECFDLYCPKQLFSHFTHGLGFELGII